EEEYEEEDLEEAPASSAPYDGERAHAHEGHDHPPADELSAEAQRAAEAAHDGDAHQESDGAPASFDEHVAPTGSFDQTAPDPSYPAVRESSGLEPVEISTSADVALSDEAEALGEVHGVETIETPTAAEAPPEEIGAQDAMEELPRRKRKPV